MKKTELITAIVNAQIPQNDQQCTKQIIPKSKNVSKALKNKVWDTYVGKEKGVGSCYCCQSKIDSKHFECGHIVAKSAGGQDTIDNLRPVCDLCNKSMGVKNMNQFKEKFNKQTEQYCACPNSNVTMWTHDYICKKCKKSISYDKYPANLRYQNSSSSLLSDIRADFGFFS